MILIGAELIIIYLGIAYLHFTNANIENQTAILVMFISHTLCTGGVLCLLNDWFDDFLTIIGVVTLICDFVTLGMLFLVLFIEISL